LWLIVKGIRIVIWSGASFDATNLVIGIGQFKDTSVFYNYRNEIEIDNPKRRLEKSSKIQWVYKNIVKRKGV
jgi:hypothetical protein